MIPVNTIIICQPLKDYLKTNNSSTAFNRLAEIDAISFSGDNDHPGCLPLGPKGFFTHYRDIKCNTLVAVDQTQKTIAGYVILYKNTISNYTIHSIAVHPMYRRQGVGTQLMQEVKTRLSQGGHRKQINLHVKINNRSAIALYNKTGFKRTKTIKHYYRDLENAANAYVMVFTTNAPAEMPTPTPVEASAHLLPPTPKFVDQPPASNPQGSAVYQAHDSNQSKKIVLSMIYLFSVVALIGYAVYHGITGHFTPVNYLLLGTGIVFLLLLGAGYTQFAQKHPITTKRVLLTMLSVLLVLLGVTGSLFYRQVPSCSVEIGFYIIAALLMTVLILSEMLGSCQTDNLTIQAADVGSNHVPSSELKQTTYPISMLDCLLMPTPNSNLTSIQTSPSSVK